MEHKLQFDFKTNQKILQKISKIDQFKGEWSAIAKPENHYLQTLRRIATVQSIGSSNRIEGNTLSDAEVESLLKHIKTKKLASRDEQEVVGYYETLDIVIDNFQAIPLGHSTLHQLHQLLLKHSVKDERHRGIYKQIANQVAATFPDGTTKVIFRTTEPFLVEKEIEEVIDWVNNHLASQELHPLILIGVFVYEFLSIHPYQDGNGRLSRLLTTLLLLRTGYTFIAYISFENIIEQQKTAYYQALIEGQKNRGQENERIDVWLLFFLDCLEIMTEKLKIKIKEYQKIGSYLSERQKKIIDFIQQNQPVQLKDISAVFPDMSANTIKKDLQYLVQQSYLEKLGSFKNTAYIIKENAYGN